MGAARVGPAGWGWGPRLGRGVRIVAQLAALAGTPHPEHAGAGQLPTSHARSEEEPPDFRACLCVREGVFCCGYFCIWWVLRLLA